MRFLVRFRPTRHSSHF